MTRLPAFIIATTVFFTAQYIANVESVCSGGSFNRYIDGHLNCGVFKTVIANSMECQVLCVQTSCCLSMNYYRSDNGTEICELNKRKRSSFNDNSCYVEMLGHEHYELQDDRHPCLDSSKDVNKHSKNNTITAVPNGWYKYGSSLYKIFKTRKKWSDAKATCTADTASLVSIDSEAESRFVADQFFNTTTKVFDIQEEMKPLNYWKLNGSHPDITLYGDATYKTAVLNLPGTAGSYATTPVAAIDASSFTVAFWVKLHTKGSYDLYSYWDNPRMFCISAVETAGKVSINFKMRRKSKPNQDLVDITSGNIPVDIWTHVVVTWDRGSKRAEIFQDGSQLTKATATGSPNDLDLPSPIRNNFDIGYNRETTQVINGQFRELVIFDKLLADSDVMLLKDKTLPSLGVWVGPTHQYTNWAPVLQSNSSCITVGAWSSRAQMDKITCDEELEFICEKPV